MLIKAAVLGDTGCVVEASLGPDLALPVLVVAVAAAAGGGWNIDIKVAAFAVDEGLVVEASFVGVVTGADSSVPFS